jgi:hypothetical protein
VADPSLLPNGKACSFKLNYLDDIMTNLDWEGDTLHATLAGMALYYPGITTGIPVTVTLRSANPAGSYTMGFTASGVITFNGDEGYVVFFNTGVPMTYSEGNISRVYSVTIGDCTTTYTYYTD